MLLTLCLLSSSWSSGQSPSGFTAKRVLLLMGTRFEFGAYAKTQPQAEAAVAAGIAEVQRIEALISSWKPSSQTSAINAAAGGEAVRVDPELLQLIRRCHKVSELTAGAFDITAGGLHELYRFGKQDTVLPSAEQLAQARALVNYRAIEIDAEYGSVRLPLFGMRIGFGAIGKGYAANRAREVMRSQAGVVGGVVNAAGDLATFGSNAKGTRWAVGIRDPRAPDRWLGQLEVGDAAVVTSGDYEKFFAVGSTRYAHIIDPRTAIPTTQVRSATVVCPDAELADALATALFVLGPEAGIALLDRLKNIEGLIVDSAGRVLTSQNLILEPYAQSYE